MIHREVMQAIQILLILSITGKKPVVGAQIKNTVECFLLSKTDLLASGGI